MSDIKLTNNDAEVLSAFANRIELILETIGSNAEGYAAQDCPVDTGRLRNSISHIVQDDSVLIGTNVDYAKYVEFRDYVHHEVGKAHFLRDSVARHVNEYKRIAQTMLKN